MKILWTEAQEWLRSAYANKAGCIHTNHIQIKLLSTPISLHNTHGNQSFTCTCILHRKKTHMANKNQIEYFSFAHDFMMKIKWQQAQRIIYEVIWLSVYTFH